MIEAGRLPRHRVALLAPGERDEWYSASVSYARALALAVLPTLRRRVAVDGPVVGMGASLGGLAALHAQRRHPGLFWTIGLPRASRSASMRPGQKKPSHDHGRGEPDEGEHHVQGGVAEPGVVGFRQNRAASRPGSP